RLRSNIISAYFVLNWFEIFKFGILLVIEVWDLKYLLKIEDLICHWKFVISHLLLLYLMLSLQPFI
ncbi:hypothetical protein KJ854_04215, partial [Patescibacteria group bacterium]|nr:hypothetical protein [Patescibacteria group bacterium]